MKLVTKFIIFSLFCILIGPTLTFGNAYSVYEDSFDTLRQGIWETSLYVHKKHHESDFATADLKCENGELVMITKKDKYSKGTIRSLFKFQGDFDISLDMKIDFDLNSKTAQHAMFWMSIGKDNDLVILMYKPSDKKGAIQMFLQDHAGKDTVFYRDQTGSFDGTVRAVRKGNKTTCYIKDSKNAEWKKLGTTRKFSGDVQVGANLRNFHRHNVSGQDVSKPVKLIIDNFRISHAELIVESEI